MSSLRNFENEERNNIGGCDFQKLYPNTDFNVFLRSCEEEILIPIEGKISGEIPKWLNGTLIRNGPGNLKFGKYQFEHLFDGSALLHKFKIKNGTVTYQCRFLRSETYKKNLEAKRIVFNEFGTEAVPDPCQSLLQRLTTLFHPMDSITDNANISIYPFGDEIYSLSEGIHAHRINPITLETEERKCISNYIPLVVHHTSHPHVTEDGNVYNLALSMGISGLQHHIVLFTPKKGKESMFNTANIVASVPARWSLYPSYMHTFGITENYFVLIQQPFSISVPGVLKFLVSNIKTSSALRWYQEEMTIITLINRKTNQKEDFYTKSFFYLHIINQFEIEDKYFVIDVCCYKNPDFVNCMFTDNLMNAQSNSCFAKMAKNRPLRFILPLVKFSKNLEKNSSLKENEIEMKNSDAKAYLDCDGRIMLFPEELSAISCETPQIFYKKFLGKSYRYFYAIGADVDAEYPGVIIKVDTEKKNYKTWQEKNCYPSEPIFSPTPNCESEDDGILMSSLIWGGNRSKNVGLLILNAKTLDEIGRVEFTTPSFAPKCLHGWYFPDNEI